MTFFTLLYHDHHPITTTHVTKSICLTRTIRPFRTLETFPLAQRKHWEKKERKRERKKILRFDHRATSTTVIPRPLLLRPLHKPAREGGEGSTQAPSPLLPSPCPLCKYSNFKLPEVLHIHSGDEVKAGLQECFFSPTPTPPKPPFLALAHLG